MKVYTLEATILLDGTYAQTVNVHDTHDAAVAKFHEFMNYQMIAGLAKMALCMVITEQGVVDKSEIWEKPIEKPVETSTKNSTENPTEEPVEEQAE